MTGSIFKANHLANSHVQHYDRVKLPPSYVAYLPISDLNSKLLTFRWGFTRRAGADHPPTNGIITETEEWENSSKRRTLKLMMNIVWVMVTATKRRTLGVCGWGGDAREHVVVVAHVSDWHFFPKPPASRNNNRNHHNHHLNWNSNRRHSRGHPSIHHDEKVDYSCGWGTFKY